VQGDFCSQQRKHLLLLFLLKEQKTEAFKAVYFVQRRHRARSRAEGETEGAAADIVVVVVAVVGIIE